MTRWFSRAQQYRPLAIGLSAQIVQYGSALLLIPFMVTRLSASMIGIWYIFIAVQSLALVCDFGFQPSFTRAIAIARSGAQRIERFGLGAPVAQGTEPNRRLTAEIVAAAHRFYRLLALGVLVILIAVGLPYVTMLARDGGIPVGEVQLAWAILSVAIALNLSFLWITPVLMGSDRVEQNYLFIIANRATFSLVGIAALLAGGGIIALSLTFLASQLFGRLIAQVFLRALGNDYDARKADRQSVQQVVTAIWPNAGRMGAVAVGGFLMARFSLFVISSFIGIAAAGGYALSLQLLTALCATAQLPMQIKLPRLIAARVAGNRRQLQNLFVSAMVLYCVIYLLGVVIIIGLIPDALQMIGSNISLLQISVLALLAGVLFFEGFHSNAGFFITTANNVPFLKPALISGVAVAAGALVLGFAGAGIMLIIAWQGLVQLAYNNWRWPVMAWQEISRA